MTDPDASTPVAAPAPRESHERLQLILDHARDYAIFAIDLDGRVTDWRGGAQAVFGYRADEIEGGDGDILFTAEDRAAGIPALERKMAASAGRADDVRWHRRKDGSSVFIDGVATALHGESGEVTGFLKIGRDASDRYRADERQNALLGELQHRVRNTIAVIRSIVRRTAAGSDTVEEMAAHLEGRIDAFARVQAIVTRDPDNGVDLTGLIEDELLAYATREGKRLTIDGPHILLRAKTAESVSLAVHELATNAVKHGALSGGRGKVAVRWSRVPAGDSERLLFSWEESGGEQRAAAPGPSGFGFELLEQYLPYELDAETCIALNRDGLRFTLDMPIRPAETKNVTAP
jgi:two-component system CheB/CheR fusion protein